MNKDIERVLISAEQIQEKVAEMAAELSRDYADKNPIFVGVLKGVVMFYADILKNVTVPCQMDFMWVSSYHGTSSGEMIVRKDISSDIKGRHVVILEDILDSGKSLNFVCKHLLTKEPASLKICTLLDKPSGRVPGYEIDAQMVGFEIPNEFVVGYGLDFDEYYRNLPYIGVLKPEVYEK